MNNGRIKSKQSLSYIALTVCGLLWTPTLALAQSLPDIDQVSQVSSLTAAPGDVLWVTGHCFYGNPGRHRAPGESLSGGLHIPDHNTFVWISPGKGSQAPGEYRFAVPVRKDAPEGVYVLKLSPCMYGDVGAGNGEEFQVTVKGKPKAFQKISTSSAAVHRDETVTTTIWCEPQTPAQQAVIRLSSVDGRNYDDYRSPINAEGIGTFTLRLPPTFPTGDYRISGGCSDTLNQNHYEFGKNTASITFLTGPAPSTTQTDQPTNTPSSSTVTKAPPSPATQAPGVVPTPNASVQPPNPSPTQPNTSGAPGPDPSQQAAKPGPRPQSNAQPNSSGSRGNLASTGAELLPVASVGLVLIGVGALLLRRYRRTRQCRIGGSSQS